MSITDILMQDGNYYLRMRRSFGRLSAEQRAEIERGFERHTVACRKIEIDPDPSWLFEAIADARAASGQRVVGGQLVKREMLSA